MNVVPLRVAPDVSSPLHSISTIHGLLPDGRFAVEDDAGVVRTCRRAASCLLKPQMGDTVLVSGPDSCRVFLIAVLEQADPTVSRIEADGALVVGGNAQSVTIESDVGVSVRSGAALDMVAAQWTMRAGSADCSLDDVRFTTRTLDATMGTMKAIGKVFETVADRVVQMTRSTLRIVEGIDQSRVGHLDCKASDTVRIHAKHTMVTAQDLVKVDGSQIHMG